ncbi:hypothetical protein OH76DRAFT_1424319, partial [Lentinus brumalis]
MPPHTDPEGGTTRTVWTDEQIYTMLNCFEQNRGQFGQGENPKKTHFEDTVKAINEAHGGTQNKPKTCSSVETKWAQMKAIYKGLLYGCGVDAFSKGEWSAHTASHKTVKQFSNTPWPFFKMMSGICSTSVKPHGEQVFAAHNTALPAIMPSHGTRDDVAEAEDTQVTPDSQVSMMMMRSLLPATRLRTRLHVPTTPVVPRKCNAAAADFTPPASQSKKGCVSAGAQELDQMSTTMDRFGTIVERGMASILANSSGPLPAEPKTPTHRNHVVATEASPLRGQAAATQSAVEEYEHLGDCALVTKFICYLEENPTVVVTYCWL